MQEQDKLAAKTELGNLCKSLLSADSDIRDIILFGSFIYAPSLAQDAFDKLFDVARNAL